MKKLLFLILFIHQFSLAQNTSSKEELVETILHDMVGELEADLNHEDIVEALYQYYQTPLNLNKANRESLEGLYLLSQQEVEAFFNYRDTYGDLISIYELQAIPGWDISLIRKLLPFVEVESTFDRREFWKRVTHNKNNFLLYRSDGIMQKQKGYSSENNENASYVGSPYKYLIRYRNSIAKDFSVGLMVEKDAGEALRWSPETKNYLFDFISFHASVFNKGKIKALLIGDYKLQFGQGLVLGGGFYSGKGAETILSIKKNSRGILPYSSVMETGYFKGIASTVSVAKGAELTGFFSANNRDSNQELDSIRAETILTSFDDYGMHRTKSEIQSKKNVQELVVGGNATFMNARERNKLGITAVHNKFDLEMNEADRVYNRFDFKGKRNTVLGVHYSGIVQNITYFGEAAISSIRGIAFVGGSIISLTSKIEYAILYRNYDQHFHSFYATSFSESGTAVNEKGIYQGIKCKLKPKWLFSAYYDYYTFPWLKFGKDNPSKGYDYMARLQFTASKKIALYYQFKVEEMEKNQSDNFTNIDFTTPTKKQNSSVNIDFKAEMISLRSRLMWSRYRQSNAPTYGVVISQDLNFDFRKLDISARYALFDSDDYDNRQYVYERDVLYSVSFPAYHGKGIRATVVLHFNLTKKMDCWLRYASTKYIDKTIIGTAGDEIEGNKRTELKAQIRYRF